MNTVIIVFTISAFALGGFGWLDTAEYRASLQAYRSDVHARLPQIQIREQQEDARYRRCDILRTENKARNTVDFTTPQGRDCLIDALEQVRSVQGTAILVRNASVALSKEPEDRQLRTAALAAVSRARDALAAEKPWLHDRIERLHHAYAGSMVMRLLGKDGGSRASFESQAAQLDEAEYAIHQPRLYQNQQIWRLEVYWPAGQARG